VLQSPVFGTEAVVKDMEHGVMSVDAIPGREKAMPIILWLLGVPLGLVIILMLVGVI
jgi:hypothetical protein